MREIKFRAWLDDRFIYSDGKKEWIYSTPDGWEYTTEDNSGNGWVVNNVSQYTGLKDKNGKEICEGDIIENNRPIKKVKQTIEWFRGGFMLKQKGFFGYSSIELNDNDSENYYKIIGNIYENPTLLN